MSVPADVAALIGVPQYEQVSARVPDRRTIIEVCVASRNANPLFWDDGVAADLTGGPVLPLSSLSTWMRPMPWHPDDPVGPPSNPLRLHFDLKERFDLPRAVITSLDVTYGDPGRPGDIVTHRQILRSVGDVTHTSLGTGRFWEIDVEYDNQDGSRLGVETYTGFGYRSTDGDEPGQ